MSARVSSSLEHQRQLKSRPGGSLQPLRVPASLAGRARQGRRRRERPGSSSPRGSAGAVGTGGQAAEARSFADSVFGARGLAAAAQSGAALAAASARRAPPRAWKRRARPGSGPRCRSPCCGAAVAVPAGTRGRRRRRRHGALPVRQPRSVQLVSPTHGSYRYDVQCWNSGGEPANHQPFGSARAPRPLDALDPIAASCATAPRPGGRTGGRPHPRCRAPAPDAVGALAPA